MALIFLIYQNIKKNSHQSHIESSCDKIFNDFRRSSRPTKELKTEALLNCKTYS